MLDHALHERVAANVVQEEARGRDAQLPDVAELAPPGVEMVNATLRMMGCVIR